MLVVVMAEEAAAEGVLVLKVVHVNVQLVEEEVVAVVEVQTAHGQTLTIAKATMEVLEQVLEVEEEQMAEQMEVAVVELVCLNDPS